MMTFYEYLKKQEGQTVAVSISEVTSVPGVGTIYVGKLEVYDDFIILYAELVDATAVPVAIRLEDVRRVAPPEAYENEEEDDSVSDIDNVLEKWYRKGYQ